jgi:hypothetical protein
MYFFLQESSVNLIFWLFLECGFHVSSFKKNKNGILKFLKKCEKILCRQCWVLSMCKIWTLDTIYSRLSKNDKSDRFWGFENLHCSLLLMSNNSGEQITLENIKMTNIHVARATLVVSTVSFGVYLLNFHINCTVLWIPFHVQLHFFKIVRDFQNLR